MERKQRAKMPASQRAKQFMPFAAVKGLEKAIVEQEQLLNRVEQVELSEEQVQLINQKLNNLKKGCMVFMRFYENRQYRTIQGKVEQIDSVRGFFKLGGAIVPLSNIVELTDISR